MRMKPGFLITALMTLPAASAWAKDEPVKVFFATTYSVGTSTTLQIAGTYLCQETGSKVSVGGTLIPGTLVTDPKDMFVAGNQARIANSNNMRLRACREGKSQAQARAPGAIKPVVAAQKQPEPETETPVAKSAEPSAPSAKAASTAARPMSTPPATLMAAMKLSVKPTQEKEHAEEKAAAAQAKVKAVAATAPVKQAKKVGPTITFPTLDPVDKVALEAAINPVPIADAELAPDEHLVKKNAAIKTPDVSHERLIAAMRAGGVSKSKNQQLASQAPAAGKVASAAPMPSSRSVTAVESQPTAARTWGGELSKPATPAAQTSEDEREPVLTSADVQKKSSPAAAPRRPHFKPKYPYTFTDPKRVFSNKDEDRAIDKRIVTATIYIRSPETKGIFVHKTTYSCDNGPGRAGRIIDNKRRLDYDVAVAKLQIKRSKEVCDALCRPLGAKSGEASMGGQLEEAQITCNSLPAVSDSSMLSLTLTVDQRDKALSACANMNRPARFSLFKQGIQDGEKAALESYIGKNACKTAMASTRSTPTNLVTAAPTFDMPSAGALSADAGDAGGDAAGDAGYADAGARDGGR